MDYFSFFPFGGFDLTHDGLAGRFDERFAGFFKNGTTPKHVLERCRTWIGDLATYYKKLDSKLDDPKIDEVLRLLSQSGDIILKKQTVPLYRHEHAPDGTGPDRRHRTVRPDHRAQCSDNHFWFSRPIRDRRKDRSLVERIRLQDHRRESRAHHAKPAEEIQPATGTANHVLQLARQRRSSIPESKYPVRRSS